MIFEMSTQMSFSSFIFLRLSIPATTLRPTLKWSWWVEFAFFIPLFALSTSENMASSAWANNVEGTGCSWFVFLFQALFSRNLVKPQKPQPREPISRPSFDLRTCQRRSWSAGHITVAFGLSFNSDVRKNKCRLLKTTHRHTRFEVMWV